ncbi:hypothetical protein VII00023_09581 [Vibrio ichthyoenteri ATCC 700023]|uniref:Lysozyme inhibitor LprI-like N-terminal domain-containing protein n=1 Tax=Vibrio ichthyoenteri ATCC 700023 TaxID=870968 RepID=F9RZ33_9VIBR|nr:lysozyme inhibitor LprI family protein [Vibrio ichthyoenteri]EGU46109.1 hypothetical protein VII00023_09581 [Vibrio ichthyoenteri ATCC 700023]
MQLKKVVMCLSVALFSISAFCAEPSSDEMEDPCTVAGGGAMAGYLCVEQKMQVADKALNTSYQQAIKRITAEEEWANAELIEPFRAAQRAWLKFRDAECEFFGLSTGAAGGWSAVQIEECKLAMTEERTEYFNSVFHL